MKNTKFIYLIISIFIVIWIIFLYMAYQAEKEFEQDIKKFQSQMDEVDMQFYEELEKHNENKTDLKNKAMQNNIDENKEQDKENKKEEQQNKIELDLEVWLKDDSEMLQEIYNSGQYNTDKIKKIEILEILYKENKEEEVLLELINSYYNNNDYKSASKYLEEIEIDKIDPIVYINIKINTIEFTRSSVDDLKDKVNKFYLEKKIDEQDHIYYQLLFDIIYNDIEKFLENIEKIDVDWKYSEFKSDLNVAIDQYYRFTNPPEYFMDWLIAFVLMKNWDYKIAEKLADQVLRINPNYILMHQIIWESSFIRKDYEITIKHFTELIDIDEDNKNLYTYYIWISNFWLGNNQTAIVHLNEIDDIYFIKNKYRYLALAYEKIWDYENMMKSFARILQNRPLTDYDFYTFFDIIFYKWNFQEDFNDLFKNNFQLATSYITACYEDLQEPLICRYARAWFHVARWEDEIAYKYLDFLVEKYPRDYLFNKIWDIYFEKWDYKNARQNYIKAIAYSQNSEFQWIARENLLETVMKLDE